MGRQYIVGPLSQDYGITLMGVSEPYLHFRVYGLYDMMKFVTSFLDKYSIMGFRYNYLWLHKLNVCSLPADAHTY